MSALRNSPRQLQLKVTRARRVTAGIIAVTVLVVVTPCVLLMSHRSQARSLSLVFERYSTRSDFFVQDVAFLWLTNLSDRTYLLPMTGGTNTGQLDTPIGLGRYKQQQFSGSYMVNCEFSGEPTRAVNPVQWGQCLTLAPHSAFRVRVPLPPEGAKRKVAVLVCDPPSGPRRFWTNGLGLSILRTLPRPAAHKVLWRQPAVLRVWCDRELSQPGEGPQRNDQKNAAYALQPTAAAIGILIVTGSVTSSASVTSRSSVSG